MDSTLDPNFVKAVFYHVPRPPRHTGGFYYHLDETNEPNKDFFHYTSGRWLWDEKNQLHERHKNFNVEELKKIAARSVGAQNCVSMVKIGEGGSNRAFRLVFDNGRAAIARLPMHDLAGPPFYSMASEVATMDFARNIIGIPAPEVFAYNAERQNPVGSEYIIMREAQGTQLGDRWPHMTMDEKTAIVHEVVELEKKMLSISFSSYGSLYYAKDALPGSMPAYISGNISDEVKEKVKNTFVIGPMVEKSFWVGERASMRSVDRGPWDHPHDYIQAIVEREARWLKEFAPKHPQGRKGPFETSPIQDSAEIHISLLEKLGLALPYLCVPSLMEAHLHHEDLYYGNLFVEGSKVTCLIDWQASWVGPLQLQARNPPLLDVPKVQRVELPANINDLPPVERKRVEEQVEKTLLLRAYLEQMQIENPNFYKALKLPHSKLLTKGIMFANDTWEGGILPLRGTLVKIHNTWDSLNIIDPCPFELKGREMAKETEDAEAFNQMRKFWASVFGWIYKDGWTSNERYTEALELFSGLRDMTLNHLNGAEQEAFKRDTQWIETAKKRV